MRLRPSAAERWVPCALSASLEAPYADEPSSPAAEEGTAAHWYVAERIEGREVPEDAVAPNGVPVTAEMRRDVQGYIDLVLSAEGFRRVEHELPMAYGEGQTGTCDAYVINEDSTLLQVFDLKYGFRPVKAKNNWQGVAYTMAVAAYYDLPSHCVVKFTIYQPRDFSQTVKVWTTTVGALHDKLGVMQRAAENALKPKPTATTGNHCLYCNGRHKCPALREVAAMAVDVSLQESPLDISDEALGPQLDVLKDAQNRLNSMVQGLEQLAENKIRNGKTIPGYGLAPAMTREKWTVPEGQVLALGDVMGVDLKAPTKPITPKQAREAGIPADIVQGFATRPTKMELTRRRPEEVFE